jgi:hypothetical protein
MCDGFHPLSFFETFSDHNFLPHVCFIIIVIVIIIIIIIIIHPIF